MHWSDRIRLRNLTAAQRREYIVSEMCERWVTVREITETYSVSYAVARKDIATISQLENVAVRVRGVRREKGYRVE